MSKRGAQAKRETRAPRTGGGLSAALAAFAQNGQLGDLEHDLVIQLANALGLTPIPDDGKGASLASLNQLAAASTLCAGAPNLLTIGRPFSGRRVVIVGAGPSLEHAAPHLERWARSSIVLAVNTSARRVCKHVRPDLVLIADPLDHSDQLAGVTSDVVALATMAHPATWEAAASVGRRAFLAIGRPGIDAIRPWIDWRTGGVCPMAVHLAALLGADEIVLAGVDLALARDGSAFASGMLPVQRPEMRLAATVGWDGEPRQVREDWQMQHRVLEGFAATHQGAVRLVNASLGGARIEGWEHVAPADLDVPAGEIARPAIDLARGRCLTEEESFAFASQTVLACRAAIAARDAQQRGDEITLAAATAQARGLVGLSVAERARVAERILAATGLR